MHLFESEVLAKRTECVRGAAPSKNKQMQGHLKAQSVENAFCCANKQLAPLQIPLSGSLSTTKPSTNNMPRDCSTAATVLPTAPAFSFGRAKGNLVVCSCLALRVRTMP